MTLGGGLVSFALGTALGALSNLCIGRFPKDESIVGAWPSCEACGAQKSLKHLVPIAGFLAAGGRCASCGKAFPRRELLVEAAGGLLAMACYGAFGISWAFASNTILLIAALTAGVIDSRHKIIPNALTIPCMGLGLAMSFLPGRPTPVESVVGLLVAGGLLALLVWAYPKGMGGGDVKFMAMAGAFLGWTKALVAIFAASFTAVLVGLALVGMGRRGLRDPLAFGPYLSLGILVAVFGDTRIFPFSQWWF